MARVGQPLSFHQAGDRGGQGPRFQVDRSQRLFAVEMRTTMEKPVINELVKEAIPGSYAKTDTMTRFLRMSWGARCGCMLGWHKSIPQMDANRT